MEIGTMKQRIAVYANKTVTDSIGNHTTQQEKLFSCWASVYVRSSAESTETGVTREVQNIEFIIRQREISTTANCIEFRGNRYNIIGIFPNYKSMDYMKIVCEMRRAGSEQY